MFDVLKTLETGEFQMHKLILPVCMAALLAAPVHAQTLQPAAPGVQGQSNDVSYRVSVLEEQVRQLTGKIEELTFQLLELQEQLRRTQEDNDYRLRELEDKSGDAGGSTVGDNLADNSGEQSLEKPQPSEQSNSIAGSDGNSSTTLPQPPMKPDNGSAQEQETAKRTIDGVEIYEGEPGLANDGSGTLGTIQFDQNGNIIDSEIGRPLELGGENTASLDMSLPDDPDGLFDAGYRLVQSGRYEDAEKALVSFSERYENHPRMPEARFWLGESYLGRKQFQLAAKTYLDAHKRWPNSKFGPQSLLKLGVAIAGLEQRELACATFAEVLVKYPNASSAVRRNVVYEQQAARCSIN
jgi:tol-pal system protein YbgF